MIGAKGDNIYFTAAEMEPEMHPLIQLGGSLAPYALAAGAGYYAMHHTLGPTGMTALDAISAFASEKAARTPLGAIASTFRIPEFLSFFTSAEYKGLEKAVSSLDDSKRVGRYIYESSFFKSEAQRKYLEAVIGKDEFENIKMSLMGDNFRIVLEEDLDARGRANLIFQEIERSSAQDEAGRHLLRETPISSRQLATVRSGQLLGYSPEILDIVSQERIDKHIQPIARAAISNLDLGINPEDVFRYSSEGRFVNASIGFFPDVSAPGIKAKI